MNCIMCYYSKNLQIRLPDTCTNKLLLKAVNRVNFTAQRFWKWGNKIFNNICSCFLTKNEGKDHIGNPLPLKSTYSGGIKEKSLIWTVRQKNHKIYLGCKCSLAQYTNSGDSPLPRPALPRPSRAESVNQQGEVISWGKAKGRRWIRYVKF